MCLCLTSHQQPRSYGNGAMALSSSDRLEKPMVEPATTGLQGEWFIHFSRVAVMRVEVSWRSTVKPV